MNTATMSQGGRVVVPKPYREKLGVKAGDEVIWTEIDGQIVLTSRLRPATRHLGLSLGERACLSLARLTESIVITADRPWLQLAAPLNLTIECIRPAP